MTLFDSTDYKKWVNARLKALPKEGRGQLRKIAEHLQASPTIITQVFSGARELTPEQAILLADYFALNRSETRYFIKLVQFARAGTHRYRESLREEIEEMRAKAKEISSRVAQDFKSTEDVESAFYANWYYLAIWSLSAIEGFGSAETIAARLGLPLRKVRSALEFLKKYSLLVEDEKGALRVGPTLIHLESSSPQIPRHHQNWRLQAFRHYEDPGALDAFYSAPVTLSLADAKKIREKLLRFVADSVDIIKDSPSEKLYCLNLDWFEV